MPQSALKILESRNSVRKYLPKPVPRETLLTILNSAKMTPSGGNVQPWQVHCVSSAEKLKSIGDKIISHIQSGGEQTPDIFYYPKNLSKKYNIRRLSTAKGYYETLGLTRETRGEQWHENYKWFGAPTVLFVSIDKNLLSDGSTGFLLDCGAFMQSIIITAKELGVDSCPQGSSTEYGKLIREELGISDEYFLLYSIVLGYADLAAPQNSFKPSRLSIDEFVTFV